MFLFFFTATATPDIYTLSLHDALPSSDRPRWPTTGAPSSCCTMRVRPSLSGSRSKTAGSERAAPRSEEHTSELQSHSELVCRLLLEKKKEQQRDITADKLRHVNHQCTS